MIRIVNKMRWIPSLFMKMPKHWSYSTPVPTITRCTSPLRSFSSIVSVTSEEVKRSDSGSNLKSLTTSEDGKFLNVTWNDGCVKRYPYIWLRDNCGCAECYDYNLNERVLTLRDIDVHAKLEVAERADDSNMLLHGTDGHVTVIQSSWLKERNVGDIRSDIQINKTHFGSDLMSYLPKFEYEEILNDDTALYKWMACSKEHGLAWIKGAPRRSAELRNLGKRIAHLRETFSGSLTTIKAKSDAFFLGDTPKELPLHTDFTYGSNVSGIMIIHGIDCTAAGAKSWFADGFRLAEDLKKNDPDAFRLLSTGMWNYEMNGLEHAGPFDHRCNTNVIRTNWRGDVDKIAFCDHTRTEYLMNIDVDDVPAYYAAYKKFVTKAYSPEYLVKVMIEEGEMVMIDNFRLLHGRAVFEMKEGDRGRYVEIIYIDQDDFDSRLRVLQPELINKK